MRATFLVDYLAHKLCVPVKPCWPLFYIFADDYSEWDNIIINNNNNNNNNN